MTIHIIFDDCPIDFNEKSILAVYSNKERAHKTVESLKRMNPYEYQYLTVISKRVKVGN